MRKFSFVIPVYNTKEYIKKCLDSILNQTYDNFEIICVNDGSTDESLDILKKYEKKDKRIKVLSISNSGPSKARNIGVTEATGDYLCFVDSDDYIETNYLFELNKIIGNKSLDIIRINYREFDKNDNYSELKSNIQPIIYNGKEGFRFLIDNGYLIDSPCLFIYNTSFWKKNNFLFEVGKFHEDFGLIPKVIILSESITFSKKTIYNYLINRKNSTMTNKDEKFILKKTDDVLYFYDKLKKEVVDNNKLDKKSKQIFLHYLENNAIAKVSLLPKKYIKEYKNSLKNRNIYKINLSSGFKYVIKKIILNLNFNLYVKIITK